MKVDIQKFDREISFNLWKVQMRAIPIQHGLWKVLLGPHMRPSTMTEEKEACFVVGLRMGGIGGKGTVCHIVVLGGTCLTRGDKTTIVDLRARLEELQMTKSLVKKIRLKERLSTFRMAEATLVQKHLNDFNSIIVDLESLDLKVEDEDKEILLVVSLLLSYKHFKEIMLYSKFDTVSFEDVK